MSLGVHTLCDIKLEIAHLSKCISDKQVGWSKMYFIAASPISIKIVKLGHHSSGEARHTHTTVAVDNAYCSR